MDLVERWHGNVFQRRLQYRLPPLYNLFSVRLQRSINKSAKDRTVLNIQTLESLYNRNGRSQCMRASEWYIDTAYVDKTCKGIGSYIRQSIFVGLWPWTRWRPTSKSSTFVQSLVYPFHQRMFIARSLKCIQVLAIQFNYVFDTDDTLLVYLLDETEQNCLPFYFLIISGQLYSICLPYSEAPRTQLSGSLVTMVLRRSLPPPVFFKRHIFPRQILLWSMCISLG